MGQLVTKLRKRFTDQANLISSCDEGNNIQNGNIYGKLMHPRSTWKHNIEGKSESQLRILQHADGGLTRNYKKHTMKELSLENRKEIVRLYVEEHMHQSDIAILYKVSKALVG